MSELSSCYFCGTALDAPVQRYPLTPPSVEAETGRSVALCPTCRRKLVKVLELVGAEFDAVTAQEGASANDTGDEDETESGTHAEQATAGAEGETDEEPAAADADADEEPAAADADADEEPATTGAGTDDELATADAPDAPESGAEASDADTAAGSPSDDEHEAAGADVASTASETAAGDGGATDPIADDGPGAADATETASDDPDAAGGAGSAAVAGGTDGSRDASDGKPELLSTPAAQDVIKLLQNREFPLDRDEFETVASNAYEIPMRDCREVIDTLVEEGYVAEDGSQLVRPE